MSPCYQHHVNTIFISSIVKSARRGIRTPTPLRTYGPEPYASTNFAILAEKCSGGDLNPHVRRHTILSRTRLPNSATRAGCLQFPQPTRGRRVSHEIQADPQELRA